MICGRCDRPISPGEEYTCHDMQSASGGGITVFRHVDPCKRVLIQTTQVSLRH